MGNNDECEEWSSAFGELARQTMSSAELERYFSILITKARAQIILQQLSLYVRHREIGKTPLELAVRAAAGI